MADSYLWTWFRISDRQELVNAIMIKAAPRSGPSATIKEIQTRDELEEDPA